VRRVILALPAVLLVALAWAAAAAADNGLAPVTPESPNAEAITQTYWVILVVTGVIFVLVEGVLVYFIIRFRSRGRDRSQEGPQVHGATKLEVASTILPVLILAGITAFVFVKLPTIKNVPEAKAANGALKIGVEAHQYYWLFKYPNGRETVNVLTVPVNRVVTLDITSADVAHSFWVPAFGGKMDAIPGKTNHTWFQAQKAGVYPIRCAEFCGIQHAHMDGVVHVVQPSQLVEVPVGAALGKQVFNGVCASCHGLSGQGLIGPAIATSATLQDPKALRDLVENGSGKMPAVGRGWHDQLVNALGAYLKQKFGGAASGG